jgi:hypothetical protein
VGTVSGGYLVLRMLVTLNMGLCYGKGYPMDKVGCVVPYMVYLKSAKLYVIHVVLLFRIVIMLSLRFRYCTLSLFISRCTFEMLIP